MWWYLSGDDKQLMTVLYGSIGKTDHKKNLISDVVYYDGVWCIPKIS